MQIYKKYIVHNMIKGDIKGEVQKRLSHISMEYLGFIPYDKELEQMVCEGLSLEGLKESPVVDKVKLIIDEIGG